MSNFDFVYDAAGYSHVNAYWLARFADLAYENPARTSTELAKLGITRVHSFLGRKSDTEGFVAGNGKAVFVAFRGTEKSLRDWLTDARIRRVDGVHRGFREALEEVWPEVRQTIHAFNAKPMSFADAASGRTPGARRSLWFTGHSLGASLAALAADRVAAEDRPIDGVYTFGQPRTGDEQWARRYNGRIGHRSFRFVNNNDLVTRVPPRSFGYSHVGTFRYFDAKGAYHEDISWWRRFVDRVEGSIDDFLKLGPDAIRDHFMKGYLSNVARAAGL